MIDEDVARLNEAYGKIIRAFYDFNLAANRAVSIMGKNTSILFQIDGFEPKKWTNCWLMVLSQTDARLTDGFLWAVGDTR